MDEFKLNVTRLVNISKIVDQPVNIADARNVLERKNLMINLWFILFMLYNKTLNNCSLGKHLFCFPQILIFPSIRLRKQNRSFPREQSKVKGKGKETHLTRVPRDGN